MKIIIALALVAILSACGGSSEPDRKTIEPVQCEPHPGGGCK